MEIPVKEGSQRVRIKNGNFLYTKQECQTLCHHVQSSLKNKDLMFLYIHKPNSFACSSSHQVTELYSGETHHIVPQFLPSKKRAIKIMGGCGNRVSCKNLFRKLQILPLTSQYLLSILMFVV
jgi:hypothetical protein